MDKIQLERERAELTIQGVHIGQRLVFVGFDLVLVAQPCPIVLGVASNCTEIPEHWLTIILKAI